MRNAITGLLAVTFGVAMGATARGEMIVADGFLVGGSQYATGDLWGQDPTVAGFTGAWTRKHPTSTVKVVSAGLTWPGLLPAAAGGSVEYFFSATSLIGERHCKRELSSYTTHDTYYMSGLMSFDTGFIHSNSGAGVISFARTGLVDGWGTSGDDGEAMGVQWGFKENADDTAVDAVVRLRTSDNTMTDLVVSAGVLDGTHLFVARVDVNYSAATDRVSVWFDPANISSEAAAGTPVINDSVCWSHAIDVDWLVFSADDIGGSNSAVGYDEVRFGSTWADVTVVPEPATAVLTLSGLLALIVGVCMRRHRRGRA